MADEDDEDDGPDIGPDISVYCLADEDGRPGAPGPLPPAPRAHRDIGPGLRLIQGELGYSWICEWDTLGRGSIAFQCPPRAEDRIQWDRSIYSIVVAGCERWEDERLFTREFYIAARVGCVIDCSNGRHHRHRCWFREEEQTRTLYELGISYFLLNTECDGLLAGLGLQGRHLRAMYLAADSLSGRRVLAPGLVHEAIETHTVLVFCNAGRHRSVTEAADIRSWLLGMLDGLATTIQQRDARLWQIQGTPRRINRPAEGLGDRSTFWYCSACLRLLRDPRAACRYCLAG